MHRSAARTISAFALSALLVTSPVALVGCSSANSSEVSSTETAELNNGTSSNATTSAATLLDADAALDIALSDAGLTKDAVTVTKAALTTDDGVDVYEIEFTTSDSEHDYTIDATTGQILEKDNETYTSTSTTATATQDASSQSADASTGAITQDAAKAIAAENAGFSASKVTFTECKLETDDGVQVYDVTFTANGAKYEYTINATTGAILEGGKDVD